MKNVLEKLFISPRKAKSMLKAQGIEDELVGKVGYLIMEAQVRAEQESWSPKSPYITGKRADNLAKGIIKLVKKNFDLHLV